MQQKEIFRYSFQAHPLQGFLSACDIELIYRPDGKKIVIATDINEGMSVTNAAEIIATGVRQDYEILPYDMIFIEHYNDDDGERFTQVSFTWEESQYINPVWQHLNKSDVDLIIDGSNK